jgi:catechol 2,3-dioxygenase-like lactoylglutathione lyase family enzyme
MGNYVDPTEQLVVELYVVELARSVAFYERLGFRVIRRETNFAELGWEDSRLFIEEVPDLPAPACPPVSNIRIMVPDVDHHWRIAGEMHLPVIRPLGDRYYGLRDFTVLTPDGVALRFASRLD